MTESSASEPRVACVVLTWNDKANLLACLDSLSRLSYSNVRIIVSDNGSTDGTIEAVHAAFPDVALIENGCNLFWAGGNNVGIEWALGDGADYVLLLNNDIVVDPDLVSELVRVGRSDPAIGMLAPKIYYYDEELGTGGRRLWYAGAKVSMWRGLARHIGIREIDRGQYDALGTTDYVTGCALMAKREVIETIGLIDPTYIAYGEDMDWSYRASRADFRLVYVPTAKLWHKIGAYWGIVSTRKIRQKLRSHAIFFWRYSPRIAWFSTIPVFQLLDAFRIGFLLLSGRLRRSRHGTGS